MLNYIHQPPDAPWRVVSHTPRAAGADGEDVETGGGGGIEANEGLSVGGGERSAAAGDGDEGSEGVWQNAAS